MINIQHIYKKIFISITFIILSINIYADEIHLIENKVIHCNIIGETRHYLKAETCDEIVDILKFEIIYIPKKISPIGILFTPDIFYIPKGKILYIVDQNNQKKAFILENPLFNFEAIVGIWAPVGNRNVIGDKIITGLSIGFFIFPFFNINATLLTSNSDVYPNIFRIIPFFQPWFSYKNTSCSGLFCFWVIGNSN